MAATTIFYDPGKGIWAQDEDADRLRNNFFGENRERKLYLLPEEALYILELQNGRAMHGKKEMTFSDLVSAYAAREPRLLIKYNAYRDWRDRGLIIKRALGSRGGSGKEGSVKKYPAGEMQISKSCEKIVWDPDSGMGVLECGKESDALFSGWWIGQSGVYKQDRGSVLKLNFFEVVLLSSRFGFKVFDAKRGKAVTAKMVMEDVAKRREFAKAMYQAYEEWRLKGYIVKTGFKFGTHFRIYFPGASPTKEAKGGEWVHSKHVLHIFPKEQKMLISEWARAVRVAHGVRKTFILGMPKLSDSDFVDYPADFAAYRRRKKGKDWIRETPKDGPRYLLAAVSEEEHIGGIELASLLKKAELMNLSLVLSITDRETAITYYALNKIKLPGAEYDYYEIEWMRP